MNCSTSASKRSDPWSSAMLNWGFQVQFWRSGSVFSCCRHQASRLWGSSDLASLELVAGREPPPAPPVGPASRSAPVCVGGELVGDRGLHTAASQCPNRSKHTRLRRRPEPARTGNRPPRLHPDADSPRDFTCRWDTVPGNCGVPPPPRELAGDGARCARRQRALGMGRPGCPCHARNPGRMRTGLARPRLPPARGTIVTCPAPHPPLVSTVRGRQVRRPRAWPT